MNNMKVLEFKCTKCGYLFTRFLSNDKGRNEEENCLKCGEKAELKKEVDLGEMEFGCSSCESCGGGCSK